MSPLDEGYYKRVNELSQLEQGNNTSIGDTIQLANTGVTKTTLYELYCTTLPYIQ